MSFEHLKKFQFLCSTKDGKDVQPLLNYLRLNRINCEVSRKIYHTVKFQFEMPLKEHVSGKNIFFSNHIGESRGAKTFEILHWPLEPLWFKK